MRKVFEIKVTSSASFYSYLALSGIDFKTKEKPDVVIFTCDMTEAEFAAAVQYCNKLAEERKFNESVEKIQETPRGISCFAAGKRSVRRSVP